MAQALDAALDAAARARELGVAHLALQLGDARLEMTMHPAGLVPTAGDDPTAVDWGTEIAKAAAGDPHLLVSEARAVDARALTYDAAAERLARGDYRPSAGGDE